MQTLEDWLQHRSWLDDKTKNNDAKIKEYVDQLVENNNQTLLEDLIHWRDNGFLVMQNAVDLNTIDNLLDDIEFIKTHRHQFPSLTVTTKTKTNVSITDISEEELNSPNLKINVLVQHSKAAADLSLTEQAIAFLQHIYLEPIVAIQSLTMLKGTEQPIHVDYPYVNVHEKISHQVATWIPLEDIHPDAGPLMYWPASHDIDKVPPFEWDNDKDLFMGDKSIQKPFELSKYLLAKMEQNGIEGKVFTPKRGDILLWHVHLSHAGLPVVNENLTRKSYVTHYTTLSSHPLNHRQKDAFENKAYSKMLDSYVFHAPWIDRKQTLGFN